MKIQEEKSKLRESMTLERDAISHKEHSQYSQSICEQIYTLVMKENYKIVHSYLPYRSEINVLPCLDRLLKKGVQVICPKTQENGLLQHLKLQDIELIEYGLYDVPFPAGNKPYTGSLDLIIVPGLAFDAENNRLGYGGGYYDRFLTEHQKARQIGVCFPFQIVDSIPVETWDVAIDEVYFKAL